MLLLDGKDKSEGALPHCWEFTANTIGQLELMIAPVPLIGEPDFSLLSFFFFFFGYGQYPCCSAIRY